MDMLPMTYSEINHGADYQVISGKDCEWTQEEKDAVVKAVAKVKAYGRESEMRMLDWG